MKKKLKSRSKFIPVNVPKIFKQEKIYVKECLDSGWISSEGKYVKKFEKDFSKYNNRIYGVAVSSGTAALHAMLWGIQRQDGSLRIGTQDFTFASNSIGRLPTCEVSKVKKNLIAKGITR